MSRYFIAGIGTGVGKTFVSAILTEALQADYWKPVQCGTDEGTDTEYVHSLISNSKSFFHEEAYCFKDPVSPHFAAQLANSKIVMENLAVPVTSNKLIIEGAGGLLVPLNENDFVIQVAQNIEAEVILVCRNYLGCINHSLLSIDYLTRNDYQIKGLVLNGNFDKAVRSAIVNYTELPVIAEFPEISKVSKETVLNLAGRVNTALFDE